MKVAIIGMGRVGAPLAGVLNKAGVEVVGIEPNEEIRTKIAAGEAPFYERGLAEALDGVQLSPALSGSVPQPDAYVICVGTPSADDGALERAAVEVALHMKDDALIIVRSTVRIGTTLRLAKTISDRSGCLYHLAYCPERTVEGDALNELRTLPQIIGTNDDESMKRAIELFKPVNNAIRKVILIQGQEAKVESSPLFYRCLIEEAELAKLLANSWRDVTFAYANEIANIAHKHGLSATEVITAANFNYPRSQIPLPGPVGGPCLTKDSHLLVDHQDGSIITLARSINRNVPTRIGFRINSLLLERGFKLARVAILGTAFKGWPPTDDTRSAPSQHIADKITHEVVTFDPIAPADHFVPLSDKGYGLTEDKFDAIVVVTNNPIWRELNLRANLNPNGFIYDCCGGVDDADFRFGG